MSNVTLQGKKSTQRRLPEEVYVSGNALWTSDRALEVPAGNVTGYAVVNKFGQSPDVSSGAAFEEIWDGAAAYPWPTAAFITHISQATDQVGTDGSATIEVQGLDTNWDLVTQEANLDASDTTTEVELTTALRRVFRLKVLENTVLAANVSAHITGGSITYATIIADYNQTKMALYTVPASKTAYMTNYYAAHHPATGQDPTSNPIDLWARDNANGYAPQIKHSFGLPSNGSFQHTFNPYYSFSEKTDIYLTSSPVGKAANVSAGFDLFLVDN